MIPFTVGHNYYKKMLELQEKLRKSEEERLKLEEKLNLMRQESQLRHEACIKNLQMRYIEFLEEQRTRDERNHQILGALDRVDGSLALMSAKTDELCNLRKEYETFLMQAHMSGRQTGSFTGDSGIVSQNEDRQIPKYIRHSRHVAPKTWHNTERKFPISFISSASSRNLLSPMSNPRVVLDRTSDLHPTPKLNLDRDGLLSSNRSSRMSNYRNTHDFALSPREPESHRLDPVLQRYSHENSLAKELPKFQYSEPSGSIANTPKFTGVLGPLHSKKGLTNDNLDNELDRYINKIRNLYDTNDPHSLEEIEQNTSGDILNITLSDDSFDHLPVEEKTKEQLPIEVVEILAVADDLVSKTKADTQAESHMSNLILGQSVETIPANEIVSQKVINEPVPDNLALINATENSFGNPAVIPTPVSDPTEKDEINDDVAMGIAKLNTLDENIESISEIVNIEDSGSLKSHSHANSFGHIDKEEVSVTSIEISGDVKTKELNDKQSEENIQKTFSSDDKSGEKNQDENMMKKAELDINTEIQEETPAWSNNENNINTDNIPVSNYDVTEQNYESSQLEHYDESYKQVPEEYSQDPTQMYEYNNEQYQHDPNQHYQYDPNLQYQQSLNEQYQQGLNEQYQYNQQEAQYIEDPNNQYQNQQYIEANNQQYAITADEQYLEYPADPSQQYPETFAPDSTTAYDANAIYEYPTQNENYMGENAYDESQGFVSEQQYQEYAENLDNYETTPDNDKGETMNYQQDNVSIEADDNGIKEHHEFELSEKEVTNTSEHLTKKTNDVIKSILDSDTESTFEKNVTNTESDFDFN